MQTVSDRRSSRGHAAPGRGMGHFFGRGGFGFFFRPFFRFFDFFVFVFFEFFARVVVVAARGVAAVEGREFGQGFWRFEGRTPQRTTTRILLLAA